MTFRLPIARLSPLLSVVELYFMTCVATAVCISSGEFELWNSGFERDSPASILELSPVDDN